MVPCATMWLTGNLEVTMQCAMHGPMATKLFGRTEPGEDQPLYSILGLVAKLLGNNGQMKSAPRESLDLCIKQISYYLKGTNIA